MSIVCQGLTKTNRRKRGVTSITFSIAEGEVFSLLGPKGAGKTTIIRMLLGFSRPKQGRSAIMDLDCWFQSPAIRTHLGSLCGDAGLDPSINGETFLKLQADMRKLRSRKKRDELIARFNLDVSIKISALNRSSRQRLALVAAFMHDPPVLILDEPTKHLEAPMVDTFLQLVDEERNRGKTILLSSPDFHDMARCCDRAALLNDGRLATVGDITWLSYIQRRKYLVTLRDIRDIQTLIDSGLDILSRQGLHVEIAVQHDLYPMLDVLTQCSVASLDAVRAPLPTEFAQFYCPDAVVKTACQAK